MSNEPATGIDLSGVPPEIRERLKEWLALAESEGAGAVEAKLEEQNGRLGSAFEREAGAVAHLLGS